MTEAIQKLPYDGLKIEESTKIDDVVGEEGGIKDISGPRYFR